VKSLTHSKGTLIVDVIGMGNRRALVGNRQCFTLGIIQIDDH